MSSPFFRSYWGVPSHSQPSVRGVPVAEAKTKASPKVISIPVHFVGPERTRSRSDSALKIQKVLRGFLVRKNMKKIAAIRNEVHQIERRVSEQETIDLIKRDAKERLRLNETLMNLLLRLDSVTSVDFGVRNCRKSVIKRAIALQEKLDLIVSSHDDQTQDQRAGEIKEDADDVSHKQSLELHIDEVGKCGRPEEISEDKAPESEDVNTGIMDESNSLATAVAPEAMPSSVISGVIPNSEVASENPRLETSTPTANSPIENEEKMITEAKESDVKETANDGFFAEESVGTIPSGEESGTSTAAGTSLMEGVREISSLQKQEGTNMVPLQSDVGRREEQNGSRELLQRMMEDNERMMGLMTELFERNDMQTRLLSSLSHRVEQLEKAFAWEKLRRKKRRNAAAADDSSDKLSDTKKCDEKQSL